MTAVGDTIRGWIVCLIPRFVCLWLWTEEIPLGAWAPHILGRVLGRDPRRVKPDDRMRESHRRLEPKQSETDE